MSDYSNLANTVINDVAVPLGDVAVSPNFSGESADAVRAKAVEFLQYAQVLANNLYVLDDALSRISHDVAAFTSTERLLGQRSMEHLESQSGTRRGSIFFGLGEIGEGKGQWRNKQWVTDISSSNAEVIDCEINGNPGDRQGADALDRLAVYRGVIAGHRQIFDSAHKDLNDAVTTTSNAVSSMPTVTKIVNGDPYDENLALPTSVFSVINGKFKEGDFNADSQFSKLKINGKGDWENNQAATFIPGETKKADVTNPKEVSVTPASAVTPTSYVTPTRTSSRITTPTPRGRTSSDPRLRYKVNEVSADDIYRQLKDKYGYDPVTGLPLPAPGSGGRISYPSVSPTGYDPASYQFESIVPPRFDSSKYEYKRPDYSVPNSADLATTTSSLTPLSYTGPGLTSFATPGPETSLTPASARTPVGGTSIPAGQFNSMIDRLNNPIVSRGAPGAPGAAGAAGSSGVRGSSPTESAPIRNNASTYGTGGSSAGNQRGSTSGAATGSPGLAAGGRGMGMMPMMPMGGPGGASAGGKTGNKDEKSQVKNQDGDLYGNDIPTVAPVISAGNRPAGITSPVKKEED